jgi:uncharacterized protein
MQADPEIGLSQNWILRRIRAICPPVQTAGAGHMAVAVKKAGYTAPGTKGLEIGALDLGNAQFSTAPMSRESGSEGDLDKIERCLAEQGYGKAEHEFCKEVSSAGVIRRKSKRRAVTLAFGITAFAMSGPVVAETRDLVPRGNEQPSFDCSTARTATARLICADLELTRLDRALGATFQKQKLQVYLPDQPRLVAEELAWIRERNERCGLVGKGDAAIELLASSKPCLMGAIQERIASLENMEQRTSVDPNEEQSPRIQAPSSAQSSQPQTIWPDPQKAIGMQSSANPASQQREQQAAASSKFELAKQQGYRPISFEDFKLDGKQLSEANAKLIMHGVYSKSGDTDVLQPSGLVVALAKRGYGDNLGVPLLADGATRDVRKYFLNCSNNIAAQLGCPITLVGHADVCSATGLIESKSIACLVVEDGW